ncbi:hypothetical protein T265_16132, partial [Opisthorchis viverrini]
MLSPLARVYRSTWLTVDDGGRASPCIRFRMVVYRSVGGLPGVQFFRAASWQAFAKTSRCLYTTQSVEERYEALQSLCRQLIMSEPPMPKKLRGLQSPAGE